MNKFRNSCLGLRTLLVYFLCFSFVSLPCEAQQSFGQSLGDRNNLLLKSKMGVGNSNIRSFNNITNQNNVMNMTPQMGAVLPSSAALSGGLFQTITPTQYSVHVLGEVNNPGVYKVLPSERLDDVIKYAGGVTIYGSNRYIQLKRDNVSRTLDLMLYTSKADLEQNPYLSDNDVVFVPLKKMTFQIEGPVKRPGLYEMKNDISVLEAVQLAGGYSAGKSNNDPFRILRFNKEEKKEVIEIKNDEKLLKQYRVVNGDIVVIPNVMTVGKKFDYNYDVIPGDNLFYPTANAVVYVIGAVAQPGAYDYKTYFGTREYLNMSGPLKEARLRGVKLVRADGSKEKINSATVINPGDTLVVPTKSVTAQTFVSWASTVLSLTSSSISTYFLVKEIQKQ